MKTHLVLLADPLSLSSIGVVWELLELCEELTLPMVARRYWTWNPSSHYCEYSVSKPSCLAILLSTCIQLVLHWGVTHCYFSRHWPPQVSERCGLPLVNQMESLQTTRCIMISVRKFCSRVSNSQQSYPVCNIHVLLTVLIPPLKRRSRVLLGGKVVSVVFICCGLKVIYHCYGDRYHGITQ